MPRRTRCAPCDDPWIGVLNPSCFEVVRACLRGIDELFDPRADMPRGLTVTLLVRSADRFVMDRLTSPAFFINSWDRGLEMDNDDAHHCSFSLSIMCIRAFARALAKECCRSKIATVPFCKVEGLVRGQYFSMKNCAPMDSPATDGTTSDLAGNWFNLL